MCGKSKPAKTVQERELPAYLEDGSKQAVDIARGIATRSYTPYQGKVVAGLSENETAAKNLARTDSAANTAASGYMEKAGQSLDSMEDFSQENLAKYKNPYTEQVVDASLRKENEAFEREKKNLGAATARVGAFGGDRQAILESGITGRHLETVGDITAKGHDEAFKTAANLWLQDNDRKMRAAQTYSAVGGDITRMNSQQIADLVQTGQTDRLLEQADLDFDYAQFIENRDWDVNNLQPLLAALSSVPHSETQTTTKYPAKSGIWGGVLGAVGTVVGGMFGAPQIGGAIGAGLGGAIDG